MRARRNSGAFYSFRAGKSECAVALREHPIAMPGDIIAMSFCARCGIVAALFLLCLSMLRADPAKDASPPVLFHAHGMFTLVPMKGQPDSYTPEYKAQPLALPAGRYWLISDVRAKVSNNLDNASMTLLSADGKYIPATAVSRNDYHTGRETEELMLTEPFSGKVQYGGGGIAPDEMWFTIVSADAPGFVPFGFGATLKPLKKGLENAVHGTLVDDIGDFYYLHLPAGQWQIRLSLTTADNSGALDASKPGSVFGAHVDLLDEQGAELLLPVKDALGEQNLSPTLVWVPFVNAAQSKSASQTEVFRTAKSQYVKLHVVPFSGTYYSKIVPLKYTLSLSLAPSASDKKP